MQHGGRSASAMLIRITPRLAILIGVRNCAFGARHLLMCRLHADPCQCPWHQSEARTRAHTHAQRMQAHQPERTTPMHAETCAAVGDCAGARSVSSSTKTRTRRTVWFRKNCNGRRSRNRRRCRPAQGSPPHKLSFVSSLSPTSRPHGLERPTLRARLAREHGASMGGREASDSPPVRGSRGKARRAKQSMHTAQAARAFMHSEARRSALRGSGALPPRLGCGPALRWAQFG